MQRCTLIYVGKMKIPFWVQAADHYRKRLSRFWKIEEIQIRDGDGSLALEQRKIQEGQRILAAMPPGRLHIGLDEKGESISSVDLAALVEKCGLESRIPAFIIGGAYGLSEEVLASCRKKLSLSALTFTHELAQVVLWEQLFRADSILRNTGYHHE